MSKRNEHELKFIAHMRAEAKKIVDNSMGSSIGPFSANPRLSMEALQDSYIAAIDELITGVMLMTASPDAKREAFARLYHMIDLIPGWYTDDEEGPEDPKDINTRNLFDGD